MVIKTKNLTKIYESAYGIKVTAVDDISLTVSRGEFICIMGSSGSGKSTFLNLVGGIDTPTRGTVMLGNTNYADLTEEQLTVFRGKEIGFIFQFFNLLPTFDVKTNVALPLIIQGQKKKQYESKVEEVIELVGIKDRSGHLPGELSGGEKQRVAIARALVIEPAVILADEPTGNLDSENSKTVLEILKTASVKVNQTIIMVTHDQKAAAYADRTINFKDGRIEQQLTNAVTANNMG